MEIECIDYAGGEVCLLKAGRARKTIWWFLTGTSL